MKSTERKHQLVLLDTRLRIVRKHEQALVAQAAAQRIRIPQDEVSSTSECSSLDGDAA